MFLRISCAILENDKHGSHMHGRFRYTVHNHFHWKSAMLIKRLDLCGLFWRQSVFTGFEFRRSIENPWNSQKLIDPTKYFMQHGNFKYSYIQGLHTHVNQSINQSYANSTLNPTGENIIKRKNSKKELTRNSRYEITPTASFCNVFSQVSLSESWVFCQKNLNIPIAGKRGQGGGGVRRCSRTPTKRRPFHIWR